MHRIAGTFPPTRRAAYTISMSHDQRSLVLGIRRLPARVASLPDGFVAKAEAPAKRLPVGAPPHEGYQLILKGATLPA